MKKLSDYITEYKDSFLNPASGFKTGLTNLDGLISIQRGEFAIIGGRSSMGKTSLLLDMALHISRSSIIGLFSMEMNIKEILRRMVANLSGISFNRIRRQFLTEAEILRIETSLQELSRRTIYFDDRTGFTLQQIESELTQLIKIQPIDVLFIDYLQLIRPTERYRNRVDEVTEASAGLKSIAKTYNVGLIVACQLNRAADSREETFYRPRLSDLRESGSIENDADMVLLLYRPYYYLRNRNASATDDGKAEIIVAKQRNGPTGVIHANFDAETMSFSRGEVNQLGEKMF